MTQNTEPTTHEIEAETTTGTALEITVQYGTAKVSVKDSDIFGRANEVSEKRGQKVLDLGVQSGEHIYAPIDDETVEEIEAAMEDTEDENARDYETNDGGKWYEGSATADGEMYDFDDGHVPADNE